jgi:hypothetical protein
MVDPIAFIESVPWTYASTSWHPHAYIVKRNVDAQSFDELALHIRLHGRLGRWGAKNLHWYLHLPDHGFYYWTMGWPLVETIIINRAKVSTDNVRYLDTVDWKPRDREILDTWCGWTECPQCGDTESVITQEWATDDMFGIYGTRLVSLRCPACDWRYL